MDFGLRVWDASSAITLDVSDRVMRFVSEHGYTIASLKNSANVSVPGMVDDGTWAVVPLATYHWAQINSGSFTMHRFGDQAGESAVAIVFRH
jgi:hypothetical protein